MEKSIIQRIISIRNKKAKSENEFANMIGVNQKTINQQLKGERAISLDTVEKIISSFEDISTNWLMTGEGPMLKSDVVSEPDNNTSDCTVDPLSEYKPRIPYEAAAGSLSEVMQGISVYQCEQLPVVQAFPKYDFTIQIKGHSMEPKYEGGDEVACKRVDDTSFIQWGRTHVLDTSQGVVIKRL